LGSSVSESSCSEGAISATHDSSARPTVMISESIDPARSRSGLRRRMSIARPAMSAG
jgi:hypothetical protein